MGEKLNETVFFEELKVVVEPLVELLKINQSICFLPMRFKFGFCETAFEPKEKTAQLKGMQWG